MNSHATRLPELAAQVCAILERSGASSCDNFSNSPHRGDDSINPPPPSQQSRPPMPPRPSLPPVPPVPQRPSLPPIPSEPPEASLPSLVEVVRDLTDADLESLLHSAAGGRAEFDRVITVAAGEAAKRSRRELGHGGLAQRRGHRSAVQLVQSITGESKGEAARQIKVGELIGETEAAAKAARVVPNNTTDTDCGSDAGPDSGPDAGPDVGEVPAAALPWQHPVTDAITAGTLSAELGHMIVRILEGVTAECASETRYEAAVELVTFASEHRDGILREDLLRHARQVRDRIDADGIEERYAQRYERRSLRTWHDPDGALNVHAVCDDQSGVFLTQMLDLALSPRRSGPRFVAKDDVEWAQRLLDDPRTNEQLAFDTFMDVIRSGAACDENSTFRTERPGVRVITVIDSDSDNGPSDRQAPSGQVEGSAFAVPSAVVTAAACTDGIVPITVDRTGRALNLGRTKRHFSAAQRVVLRARDGGCLWPGCDRPPWQTEAHHINEWDAHNGRTDIADGVLLCRFHHLNLHNHHWRIRRQGSDYELIPPAGTSDRAPISLRPKSVTWSLTRRRTG